MDFIFVLWRINVVECGVNDAISVSDYFTIHATPAISRSHRPDRVSFLRNIHAIRPEDIEYELDNRLVSFICDVAC